MMHAILYTNAEGRKVPMGVTLDGMQEGETETDYLTRMIDVFVPEAFRASAEVVDKVTADAAAAAVKPTVLAYEAFEGRFTTAEQDGVTDFVYETSPNGKPARKALLRAYNRSLAKGQIDLTAQSTINFMDALVAAGVLTQVRRDEILTP